MTFFALQLYTFLYVFMGSILSFYQIQIKPNFPLWTFNRATLNKVAADATTVTQQVGVPVRRRSGCEVRRLSRPHSLL